MTTSRGTWPIVVGGCPRSGTSLIRRVLNSHSRIHCGPEVKFFPELAGHRDRDDPLERTRFIASARQLVPDLVLRDVLGAAFVELHERAAALAGKGRWADKNPGNVLFLDEWRRLLGDRWLFVHVVRNPLDTLASMKEVGFRRLPTGLDERIALYRRHFEAGLAFEASAPDRYRRVLYDELVHSPRPILQGLMAWMAEAFEPAQLRFNDFPHGKGLEDPKIASTSEIHAASVGRWREVLADTEAAEVVHATRDLWASVDRDRRWTVG